MEIAARPVKLNGLPLILCGFRPSPHSLAGVSEVVHLAGLAMTVIEFTHNPQGLLMAVQRVRPPPEPRVNNAKIAKLARFAVTITRLAVDLQRLAVVTRRFLQAAYILRII